ncbi:hypothetical protein [Clostridioides difficile]|uniref:hypothetical protein n=1 Tax=Clostridioides difficile TaxID=1496 RepID=UPI00038D5477|nr:hypothetical protein [Clostridioides difficile]EQE83422.1 hypothetical protein QCW_3256 [Clostridioides difficile CD69]HBE9726387.1 hypothetical protein [Clostridioides difficile]HBF7936519.1 hypothetical protein [Clostridioides difficile]HBG6489824.1 hypothetical protein [Clostridioides difficile]HBY2624130.1 hypothetical protein [Clostridioides difficile]
METENIIKSKRRPLQSKGNTITDISKDYNEEKLKGKYRKSISELFKIILNENK